MQLNLKSGSWQSKIPANIRLDEDVLKTSSSSSEDVLVKTNIFVLAIRLQDVFKTFSRRLEDQQMFAGTSMRIWDK